MTYEINGLGSGWAHAGQLSALELLALKAESLVSGPKAEIAATPPCWGIDGSYYCKNAVQVVNDAIAAGASFVIWKASDAVQLKAGSSSDVGNYIDPTFYDVVQACYEKVPVFGYHFLHLDNAYFGALLTKRIKTNEAYSFLNHPEETCNSYNFSYQLPIKLFLNLTFSLAAIYLLLFLEDLF